MDIIKALARITMMISWNDCKLKLKKEEPTLGKIAIYLILRKLLMIIT